MSQIGYLYVEYFTLVQIPIRWQDLFFLIKISPREYIKSSWFGKVDTYSSVREIAADSLRYVWLGMFSHT